MTPRWSEFRARPAHPARVLNLVMRHNDSWFRLERQSDRRRKGKR